MILLYIVGGFVFLLVSVKLITRRYFNPWRLYLVFGKKGSGKSTYLVKLALKYLKKGTAVYTNMSEMLIPGVRLIDVNQLGDFIPDRDSVLLLDEVGMIWDNRNFKTFKQSVRDFFKLQRHYHVTVYLASQTFDVDKKIRDLTDGMILFVNVLNVFSIGRPIVKRIVLTESTSEAESKISENLKFKSLFHWKITFIPKYAKYFDSFDVPDIPRIPYKVILSRNPGKVLHDLKEEVSDDGDS